MNKTSAPKYTVGDKVETKLYAQATPVQIVGLVPPEQHKDTSPIYVVEGVERYSNGVDQYPNFYGMKLESGQSLLNEYWMLKKVGAPPKYKEGDKVVSTYPSERNRVLTIVSEATYHRGTTTPSYMVSGMTSGASLNEMWMKDYPTPKYKEGDKVILKSPVYTDGITECVVTIKEVTTQAGDNGEPVYLVTGYKYNRVSEAFLEDLPTKTADTFGLDEDVDLPVALKTGDRVKQLNGNMTGTVTGIYRNATQNLDAIYYVTWDAKGGEAEHTRGEYRKELTILHAPRATDGAVKNAKALEELEALRAKAKAQIEESQETLRALNAIKKTLLDG